MTDEHIANAVRPLLIAAALAERERIIGLLERAEFTSLEHVALEAAVMIRGGEPAIGFPVVLEVTLEGGEGEPMKL